MAAPIIPWQPSNIPLEIQKELDRRKVNRSFNYKDGTKVGWDAEKGDWNKYRGPMVAWVRMCSNGAGRLDDQGKAVKERFVLHGGKDFYTSYGYHQSANISGRHQIIGWTPGNTTGAAAEPHIIETTKDKNYPIGVPNPEITKIDVTIQKELFRRANVEWVCFSWEQLNYMTPYFLIPRITIMLEWGWNLFNPASLVDLADIQEMRNLFNNPYPLYTDHILRSCGNYDVLYGFVTNFNWSVEGNKIIVNTEITSKDRLYAGISKDSTLYFNSQNEGIKDQDGILQSVRQFFSSDDTATNLIKLTTVDRIQRAKAFADSPNVQPIKEIFKNLETLEARYHAALQDQRSPEARELNERRSFKRGYLSGIFYGRGQRYSKVEKELGLRSDKTADFDKISGTQKPEVWLNMGLVVEFLNYFSRRMGVGDNPMFEVDIDYSIIAGHPNLISCDRRVLIPNSKAPKFHYGLMGSENITNNKKLSPKQINEHDYFKQKVKAQDVQSKADEQLYKVFYQGNDGVNKCYRNDIDAVININRKIALSDKPEIQLTYSFPSKETKTFSTGQVVKEKYSGFLSNIYISLSELKRIVVDNSTRTYVDIYNAIFQTLNAATDGFWDLTLVENQKGKLTVVDRNYASPANFQKSDSQEKIYDFNYYDADSIIKSLKFRPQLSDAQATRAIYSNVNKPDSNLSYSDRNDLLDYKFLDAVILSKNDKDSVATGNTQLEDMRSQLKSILRAIQVVDSPDDSLQMTIALTTKLEKLPGQTVTSTPSQGSWAPSQTYQTKVEFPVPTTFEIVKLVLPSSARPLLRQILDDQDFDNNPSYCAIQPGITAEITLQGVGGLRTFQYFRIKNLPEPYSHKNIVFRIIDVVQSVNGGVWETVIKAGILPLRKYIADQLGITDVKFDKS